MLATFVAISFSNVSVFMVTEYSRHEEAQNCQSICNRLEHPFIFNTLDSGLMAFFTLQLLEASQQGT
jgi:hypothetical protein